MAVKAAKAPKPRKRSTRWLDAGAALKAAERAELSFVEAVRQGLPVELLDRLVDAGHVTWAEITQVVVPARTLTHRRQHNQPLSPEESDQLARMLRLVALTETTFGDRAKAHSWLRRRNRALDNRVPLELLDTDGGARAVEAILGRITHGVYS
jgi:putative toxin-antitoxin system antitoxin component (TIGR02293 family)